MFKTWTWLTSRSFDFLVLHFPNSSGVPTQWWTMSKGLDHHNLVVAHDNVVPMVGSFVYYSWLWFVYSTYAIYYYLLMKLPFQKNKINNKIKEKKSEKFVEEKHYLIKSHWVDNLLVFFQLELGFSTWSLAKWVDQVMTCGHWVL